MRDVVQVCMARAVVVVVVVGMDSFVHQLVGCCPGGFSVVRCRVSAQSSYRLSVEVMLISGLPGVLASHLRLMA